MCSKRDFAAGCSSGYWPVCQIQTCVGSVTDVGGVDMKLAWPVKVFAGVVLFWLSLSG